MGDSYNPDHCQFGNQLFCVRLYYGVDCDRINDKVKFPLSHCWSADQQCYDIMFVA